jgi:hypothetical protein
MDLEPAVAFERENCICRERKKTPDQKFMLQHHSLSSHLPLCVVIHAYYINNAYKTRTRLSGASGRGCDSGCIFMSSAKCFKQKVFDVCACRVRGDAQAHNAEKTDTYGALAAPIYIAEDIQMQTLYGFVNCSGFF